MKRRKKTLSHVIRFGFISEKFTENYFPTTWQLGNFANLANWATRQLDNSATWQRVN